MIRTISIYAALLVGLVLTFTGFFAAIGAAWLFLGGATALVLAVGIGGTAVAGISSLFINEREWATDRTASPDSYWAESCAQEGANVVSLRGRG